MYGIKILKYLIYLFKEQNDVINFLIFNRRATL